MVTPNSFHFVLCRRIGDDERAFALEMKNKPSAWKELMHEIGGAGRDVRSTGLPDPLYWREDIRKLMPQTGLRREEFSSDKPYMEAVARLVSPIRLPEIVPLLPRYFVRPPVVEDVISELLGSSRGCEPLYIAVTGMGGAGKSLIASAVTRDRKIRRRFTDGFLWLNDEPGDYSEQRLQSQLLTLSKQFRDFVLSRRFRQGPARKYHDADFENVKDATEYFAMWQKKYNLRCLLVVDGAWNTVRTSISILLV